MTARDDKVLVVVHSVTGVTATVAGALVGALRADLCVIRAGWEPRGTWGVIRGGVAALRGTLVDVRYDRPDWTRYGTVVLACPVWAARVSNPMRSFLAHEVTHLPARTGLVMTQTERARPDAAFADFTAICGQAPIATGYMNEAAVRASTSPAEIETAMAEFLYRLRDVP